MDPVTHFASGAVAGRIGRDKFGTRLAWAFTIACAMVPDVDIFLPGDPESFLRLHRGITHSLAGGAALGILVALAFRCITPRLPLRRTLLPAIGLVWMHLFLDVMTTYGTQLLAPFSHWRAALPGLFIIDIFFTLSLFVVLALSLRMKRRGRLLAWVGLLWIFFYPLTCMNLGQGIESRLAHRLVEEQEAGPGVTQVDVIPDALAPLYWKVIAVRGENTLMGSVRLGASGEPLAFTEFPTASRNLLSALAAHDSLFATWSWFADYPVQMDSRKLSDAAQSGEGGYTLEFADLRFITAVPFLRGLMGGPTGPDAAPEGGTPDEDDASWPFTLTARFGLGGEYLGLSFNRHGEAFIRPALE